MTKHDDELDATYETLPDWVSLGICPGHPDGTRCVRLATRWQTYCSGCTEPIRSGAVGLATYDGARCNDGGVNHQHSCGYWNAPTEVTERWDDQSERLETVVRRALGELRDRVAEEKQARFQTVARWAQDDLVATVRALARGDIAVTDLPSADDPDGGIGYDPWCHELVVAYPVTHDEWVTRTVRLPGSRATAGWHWETL